MIGKASWSDHRSEQLAEAQAAARSRWYNAMPPSALANYFTSNCGGLGGTCIVNFWGGTQLAIQIPTKVGNTDISGVIAYKVLNYGLPVPYPFSHTCIIYSTIRSIEIMVSRETQIRVNHHDHVQFHNHSSLVWMALTDSMNPHPISFRTTTIYSWGDFFN